MSGQMNFVDSILGDFEQRLFGIETMVDRIDEHIVDVEQDAATAALREFGQEGKLGHLGRPELQVTRHVLDEDAPAQGFLHLRYVRYDPLQRLAYKASAADR